MILNDEVQVYNLNDNAISTIAAQVQYRIVNEPARNDNIGVYGTITVDKTEVMIEAHGLDLDPFDIGSITWRSKRYDIIGEVQIARRNGEDLYYKYTLEIRE